MVEMLKVLTTQNHILNSSFSPCYSFLCPFFCVAIKPRSRVWVLDRRAFQHIMMRTGLQRIEENVKFLRSVPLLQTLDDDVLCKIADVLQLVRLRMLRLCAAFLISLCRFLC